MQEIAETAIGTVVKTYSLRHTTQHYFPRPLLVPFAACAKPRFCLIYSAGPSLLLTETRGRKVRVWVARTSVSMETDGLEIVRGGTAERKLNRVVQDGRAPKRTGPKTWSSLEGRTRIIQLIEAFTVIGGSKYMETQKK